MSRSQYRQFLLWYFFAILPMFTFLFFAFLVLGSRTDHALFNGVTSPSWAHLIGIGIYFAACGWPFLAAAIRRLHDLEYEVWQTFFTLNPLKTRGIGRDILHKRGTVGDNPHGEDPDDGHLV